MTDTNNFNYNITSNLTDTIDNIWTNRADWVLTIDSNTDSSSTYVTATIWDGQLTIDDTPSSWDSYKIDSNTLEVTKNGNSIAYTGEFEKIDVWDNNFAIESDGSFDYTVNFKYHITYR